KGRETFFLVETRGVDVNFGALNLASEKRRCMKRDKSIDVIPERISNDEINAPALAMKTITLRSLYRPLAEVCRCLHIVDRLIRKHHLVVIHMLRPEGYNSLETWVFVLPVVIAENRSAT